MIDRDTATRNLSSGSIDDRLKAARFFSALAKSGDKDMLEDAMRKETAPWVKRALQRAIETSSKKKPNNLAAVVQLPSEPLPEADDVTNEIRAKVVEEVTSTILHEFTPIIGSLRLAAIKETLKFENSQTKFFLDQVSSVIEGIGNLKKAAGSPTYSDFNLVELVQSILDNFPMDSSRISINLGGESPFMVFADRDSLYLAIINGLRNAIEAVQEYSYASPAQLTINWGRAGHEDWLVILDTGKGFTGNPNSALSIGVTNKELHIGYGLSIAQVAMQAMEGNLSVSNREEGGARFELRWYKKI